jgi:hypothetical protein
MTPWELLTTCQGLRAWLSAFKAQRAETHRPESRRLLSSKVRDHLPFIGSIKHSGRVN